MEINSLFDEKIEAELTRWGTKFGELGSLYAGLPELFSTRRSQQIRGRVEDGACLVGPVHVGSKSIVCAGAVIMGPAIVADNVMIGSSVEIGERTYIGQGCSISHGATIRNSLILNGATICAGAYISNSLVETGCTISPRALLGVNPLGIPDKKGACTPFVAVGMHSRVGAGAILECGIELAKHGNHRQRCNRPRAHVLSWPSKAIPLQN